MDILMDAGKTQFYYCDEGKFFDLKEVVEFVDSIKATSFKRAKTKNVNGYWQIVCFDKANKIKGFILTKNHQIRMVVHNELIKDER